MRKPILYTVFLFVSVSIFLLSCQKEMNRNQQSQGEIATVANGGLQKEAKKTMLSSFTKPLMIPIISGAQSYWLRAVIY